jgi:hypothetical protein
MLDGRKFCIPLEGADMPALGFVTWRYATGDDPDTLGFEVVRAFRTEPWIQSIIRLSEQHGCNSPEITVAEIVRVPFWRGRWNPRPGLIYYNREDEETEQNA